jgi:DNA transformation protein
MTNEDVEEMFAGLGPVTIRRMFGGKGVYHQGLIVAVEIGGVLWLKTDAVTAAAFEAAGAEPWGYARPGGKSVQWPYWTIPDAALDDPDAMAQWARLAYEAALRAPPKARSR